MFSTYREPMMNNPPANNEFFNPASQQQMQYSVSMNMVRDKQLEIQF